MVVVLLVVSGLTFAHASDEEPAFDEHAALQVSQAALGREIGGYSFVSSENEAVSLHDLRGQPLVISMIYTSCHHFCPMITESLYRAVEGARDVLGDDAFTVVTIGFDTRYDTPRHMAAYASSRGIDLPNWMFLSASDQVIADLSEDTGFQFFDAPFGYEHLAQISVVDADGKIYTQVYGTWFEPPALIEPLKDLLFGGNGSLVSIEGVVDRIRLWCTVYDPRSDRYLFDYSIFVGLFIGAMILASVGFILARNMWRLWRPGASG
jgi:protein SCO1/2